MFDITVQGLWEDFKASLSIEAYEPYEVFIQDFLEGEDLTEDEFELNMLSHLLSDLHYREVTIRYTHDTNQVCTECHCFELSDRYGSFSASHQVMLAALLQVMIIEQRRYDENPL